MILKSITPKFIGPFVGSTLRIEPDVTVLTGANDVGKSFVLRAIELLCCNKSILGPEVNHDRGRDHAAPWTTDSEIACEAVFEVGNSRSSHPNRSWREETKLSLRRPVNHDGNKASVFIEQTGESRVNNHTQLECKDLPRVIRLPMELGIREVIEFASIRPAEAELMRLAFGDRVVPPNVLEEDSVRRLHQVEAATERLNGLLTKILPSGNPLRMKLVESPGDQQKLGVAIIDQLREFSLLGSRGSGVRKVIDLFGCLLLVATRSEPTIILFDEPETSLHADAQHALRQLLESLGSRPHIQVIYATHSPAMINSFKPHQIRIVKRELVDGKVCSVFQNEAFDKNFLHVRASLGVSPADSLLYAPITILCEGKSEVLCLPQILEKLAGADIINADDLSRLLPMMHVLDGEGSNFETIFQLAASQRSVPIVFLDGDKHKELRAFLRENSTTKTVCLPDGREIEDLVPRPKYFAALSSLLDDGDTEISCEAFNDWESRKKPKAEMMFSKRVSWWLHDLQRSGPAKHRVLQKAIEMTSADEIDSKPFIDLFLAIKELGSRF